MVATIGAGASSQDTHLHYIALLLLVPAWYCIGKLAQRAKLPLITGFVVGGIICGPSGLNLLKNEAQQTLRAVDHACLAIIALTAGAELHFDNIKRIHKQVIAITLGISISTWVFVFMVTKLLAANIPFLGAVNPEQVNSIASLAAMLMIARSPASAIAVVKETGGKGPYCSLILAVVVMKDVLVFVCFAVNLEFTRMMQVKGEAGEMRLAQVVQPFLSLGASLLWGVMAGVLTSAFINWRPTAWKPVAPVTKRLPLMLFLRLKTVGVAGVAALVFWLADRAGAEPLLACVTAGIVTANRRGPDPGKGGHEDVAEHTARLMVGVNTTFFGLAGSSLRLGALLSTVWVALMVWAARLLAIYAGSWLGGWLGGTPTETRRRVWQGMITQAGVAMGLAKTVSTRFPSWGPEFATLMFAIILLNLFVGPPLFRSSIFAAGEARAGVAPDAELSHSLRLDTHSSLAQEEAAASAAEKGHTKTPVSGSRSVPVNL